MTSDVENVLADWMEQALSLTGQRPPNVGPSKRVAEIFMRWWRSNFAVYHDESLSGVCEGTLSLYGEYDTSDLATRYRLAKAALGASEEVLR